jgi:HAD superfamily hydrolase (TIGR01490 family)
MSQRLAEAFAGKRMLLTGATGFVGEALLERVLSELPETSVVLVVRPRGTTPATERIDALLAKPAFSSLRERLGEAGMAALRRDRVSVLEGDLDEAVPDLPGDLDVVIHCAGEVSFDPAIDDGFETNVHGTLRLLDAVAASGSRPHYVHVSTAYVAGRRVGHVAEGRLDHHVDWRGEAAAAAAMRARVEADSRTPERLAACERAARAEHAASGPMAVVVDTERRRAEWVDERMVEAGRMRARSLGWTDCYTFTKAMAERAVEETAHDLPVTITRPSIIESAVSWPFPGWIEGFKMAEPIILAFGRGDLPDFPGNADGVIDIIPVDMVVNAILAAAARLPEPGEPEYFTICSGARNPLRFHDLYEIVREHFTAAPVVQHGLGAVRLPTWTWPGVPRVGRLLNAGERAHKVADRVVTSLPRSRRTRDWARTLDRRKRQLDFMRRYFDLYQPYSAGDVGFTDRATARLYDSLHPDDKARFGFDVTTIDWRHYLGEVHVPTVAAPLRAYAATSQPRVAPPRTVVEGPSPSTTVAVFDMDGTLLDSNVVTSYLWLRLSGLDAADRARELGDVARALPAWLLAERRDRGSFLRSVYRRYAGASLADLDRLVDDAVTETVLARLAPGAVRAVREHRAAGHRLVLLTGAITALTRPVAPLFDEIVAAELATDDTGRCTGHLRRPPLVGEARAAWLRHRAGEAGWDLSASYAYADSASDLPLLQAVGHPVAVDPDVSLSRTARRNRWAVESWVRPDRPSRLAVAP